MGKRLARTNGDESWRAEAACRPGSGHSPDLWFPKPPPSQYSTRAEANTARRRRKEQEQQAIAICKQCPVRHECAEYADINDEENGIWGGMTPNQRGKQPIR